MHQVYLRLVALQDHARRPQCGSACSASMSSPRASYGPPERQSSTGGSPWRARTAFSCPECLVAPVLGVYTRLYAKSEVGTRLQCSSVAARVPGYEFSLPEATGGERHVVCVGLARSPHTTQPCSATTIMRLGHLVVVLAVGAGWCTRAPSRQSISIGSAVSIDIEQEFEGAEEGSVVWDASRSLLGYLAQHGDLVSGKRVLEIGAGTGVVGITLARDLGAKQVVITDKHSQIALMERNVDHHKAMTPGGLEVAVEVLCWEPGRWRYECVPALAAEDAFDVIIVCDCVYPSQSSSHLAGVLLELLELNQEATILLAFEKREARAGLDEGTDYPAEFFEVMRANAEVEDITEGVSEMWRYEELSVWSMRRKRVV